MYDVSKYPDAWYRQQVMSVLGLDNEQDIQDAMQEARIAVWQGKRVRWALINWLRSKTKYRRRTGVSNDILDNSLRFGVKEGDDAWMHPKTSLGEDALIALLDVKQRLSTIPEKQLRALLLSVDEGLSGSEIAAKLHCTRSNVWSLLIKARKKLREGG